MDWITAALEAAKAAGVKQDMIAPTVVIAVALYMLFSKRMKSIEDRVSKLEKVANKVDVVESRTKDIFDMLMQRIQASPSTIVGPTAVETFLIRENDRLDKLREGR